MRDITCLNKSVLQVQISAAYYFLQGIILYENSLQKKYADHAYDLTKYSLEFISCRDWSHRLFGSTEAVISYTKS